MNLHESSRRDVLKVLGATGLALAGRPRVGACQDSQPAPSPRLRWAMGWLLWRDFTGRAIPFEEALQDLKGVGADGIEFTPRPGELEARALTIDRVKALLQQAGLSVSAHYFSAPFPDAARRDEILRQAQEKFDSLRAFGARHLVIGPPAPLPGANRLEAIRSIAPMLNEIGRRASDHGLVVGIHPHLNTVIETPEETDAIMAATDPKVVGLALDTGHFHLAGGDVLQVLQTHGSRLNYLHFKDAVRPFARPDFFPNLRELGRGEVDFPGVMRALERLRYTGWINVEQDFTSSTPRESAETSMRYVRDVLVKIRA
jgi:inosose dehydratase